MQLPELVRCQSPQRTMLAHRVVVRAPRFDSPGCIVETDERILVQTLFAHSAAETLDVRVFHRLRQTDELQFDAMFTHPWGERLRNELWPVITWIRFGRCLY